MPSRVAFMLLVPWLSPLALAQADEPPVDLQPEPRWRASAELSLWRPALQDDIALPGAAAIRFQDMNLDEPELAPFARAIFTNDEWTIELAGFVFETDASGAPAQAFQLGSVAIAPGERYDAEADYSAFWALATRRVASVDLKGDATLSLDLGGGARVSDMRVEIVSAGARDVGDSLWVEALAAARVNIELPGKVGFQIFSEAGGGLDSFTWSVGSRLDWRPNGTVGAHVGYRFISTNLDDDGFEYEGAIAGLFAGLTIEF
jgi:hypothetical protein